MHWEQCSLESDNETIGRCVMVGRQGHDVLGARGAAWECGRHTLRLGDHQEWMRAGLPEFAETVKGFKEDLLLSL